MAKTTKTKKAKSASYFENYSRLLENVISDYRQNITATDLFATNDYAIFNGIQTGITKNPLRYYQMDALFLLDYIYSHSQAELNLKKDIPAHRIKDFIADLLDEIEEHAKAPFLAYEMATGSGKTMLMGASIYFLNKKYGVNNFLIITPASTDIYQKTIRNFEIGNFESVWADDTPFTFNLITGDNFTQRLDFNENADANIFVFNISKFGSNANRTELPWEDASWLKQDGSSISIRKYLKDQKLVIITDEAHHAQTKTANKIIKHFHPLAVLEFTATAVDEGTGLDKKNQNIVYKYDIRRFLEDGHGKLVRAIALASVERQKKGSFSENEKLKLVTLLLIHLLKKEAVLLDPKCRELKPIAFVKVKDDTEFTQVVFDYIKTELSNDIENIHIILDKVKEQDLEITVLLQKLFKETYKSSIKQLSAAIQKVANSAIFYYGKSDKETEKRFANIRKNDVELVVYMQRLDEGIDLPNIFSMAIISDTVSDFKTSVKQIIGRGIRLNKDKREFDDIEDLLLANSEKLHIVCDQGKNFENEILAIQKEFGLNNKYLGFERKRQPIINRIKSEWLKDKYIPHIKADLKAREGVSLMALINETDKIVGSFIDANCFEGETDDVKRFLKYRPDSFFVEVDIFADKNEYHKQIQQRGGFPEKLLLADKELKTIYSLIQKSLYCLPDSEMTRSTFKRYIETFNAIGLKYYRISDSDDKLAKNLFVNAFAFFYRNHIEKHYFKLDFRQLQDEENWSLYQRFKSYELKIPEDQIENEKWKKISDKDKIIDLIESQYHFYGNEKSAYDYDKFDSFTEFQLATSLDDLLEKEDQEEEAPITKAAEENTVYKLKSKNQTSFWLRNQRNIWFTYGSKKYYPDFIVSRGDIIYVIETKGEIFSDLKKNKLVAKLNEAEGIGSIKGYKGIVIYSDTMDRIRKADLSFNDLILEADKAFERSQAKYNLIVDPLDADKFKKYLPVYTPIKAFKHFIKKQKTATPDGWLEVESRTGDYDSSFFAIQVKSSILEPGCKYNEWAILRYTDDMSSAIGNVSLVFHNSIQDEGYGSQLTLRKLSVEETKSKKTLFTEKKIVLEGFGNDIGALVIPEDFMDDLFIVGIKV